MSIFIGLFLLVYSFVVVFRVKDRERRLYYHKNRCRLLGKSRLQRRLVSVVFDLTVTIRHHGLKEENDNRIRSVGVKGLLPRENKSIFSQRT